MVSVSSKSLTQYPAFQLTGRQRTSAFHVNAGQADAGPSAISKLTTRFTGLKAAVEEVVDARSFLAEARKGLLEINDILVEMNRKASEGISDNTSFEERKSIVLELADLAARVDQVVEDTTWDGKKILDGMTDFGGKLTVRTGGGDNDYLEISGLKDLRTYAASLSLTNQAVSGEIFDIQYQENIMASDPAISQDVTNIPLFDAGEYAISANYNGLGSIYMQVLDDGAALAIDSDGSSFTDSTSQMMKVRGLDGGDVEIDFGKGLTAKARSEETVGAGHYLVDFSLGEPYTLFLDDNFQLDSENAGKNNFFLYSSNLNSALDTVADQLSLINEFDRQLSEKEDGFALQMVTVDSAYTRYTDSTAAGQGLKVAQNSILEDTALSLLLHGDISSHMVLGLFK